MEPCQLHDEGHVGIVVVGGAAGLVGNDVARVDVLGIGTGRFDRFNRFGRLE